MITVYGIETSRACFTKRRTARWNDMITVYGIET